MLLGVDEVKRNLLRIAANTPEIVADALYDEAVAIMKIAKSRTPVATGALRDSGTVWKWDGNKELIQIKLTFGVPEPGYAIFVHEDLQAKHTNGQAKFLESALLEAVDGMPERLIWRIEHGWRL